MRNVFDRPNRRDRRIEDVVALCASRSTFARGYTRAEHNRAMDRLLDDLDLACPAATDRPEIVVRHARDEAGARLRLAGAC